ncbi:hypothetical protein [Cupriavidus numazuensis]|uniref:Phasin domain-containing protein n=1 Tax=Cupriavidus numazuensis TaxID=221992 RepID=A0ABM8TD19_9BURK|nr:hypothetical protein [Cupriavidus numazuensis]CAG2136101.1 hypothetical protein LMG26411_01195 [Cupriavidus numazuensis]
MGKAKETGACEKGGTTAADGQESDPNKLDIYREEGEATAESIARVAANPVVRGAWTARHYVSHMFGEANIGAYVGRLVTEAKAVADGNLSAIESMLATQATTLDAVFNQLAMKAFSTSHMPAKESLLRLALKAQAQCASTAKVLGELKNPRAVAFVKQANIAHGNQQVNNGVGDSAAGTSRARTEKPIVVANELLEAPHGERMDPGTASPAGRGNKAMEAVGAVNRAHNRRG